MKKILLMLVSSIVVLIFLAQTDDELSDEATNLISRVETGETSESYLFLSGIFAAADESPIEAGKSILLESRKLEADESYDVVKYADSKKIELPQGELFCRVWDDGCLALLFASEKEAANLLSEYNVLVSRTNRFLEFTEYQTLSKPIASEQLPNYQYIAAAERIKLLSAIETYKRGEQEKAIELLLEQFLKLRKSFELQDNLVGKLVFLSKLSDIIDVTSIILSETGIKNTTIPRLYKNEKNLARAAAREFAMSYDTFKHLDKQPDFFEAGANYPSWLIRLFFKPNMTINTVVPVFSRLEKLALLSPREFVDKVKEEGELKHSTSKFRNYVGSILVDVATPNFDKYAASILNLDVKLALFNHIYQPDEKQPSFENPYYEGETANEVDGGLCFKAPFEGSRSFRCLKIKR